MKDVQRLILEGVTTEQALETLPSEISLASGRHFPTHMAVIEEYDDGDSSEEDEAEYFRGYLTLTSLETAKYVRMGINLRNSLDLSHTQVYMNGRELKGEERREAEKLLGAIVIM
ncbi:hypothetical protein QFC19_008558 [Naganishia cerealis]|uniref:Uncharacterized protein n=1 Tax=Naganishia cerealis TaxID=610337 RepID=A0ACC2V1F6_9TREE|nr:hypothetical protein QFC19_008558 [Naganishia cerealis]